MPDRMLQRPPGPGDLSNNERAERNGRQSIVKVAIEVVVFESGRRALSKVAAPNLPVPVLRNMRVVAGIGRTNGGKRGPRTKICGPARASPHGPPPRRGGESEIAQARKQTLPLTAGAHGTRFQPFEVVGRPPIH